MSAGPQDLATDHFAAPCAPETDVGHAAAVQVLHTEARALDRLAEDLDATFDHALDILMGCAGRVVVTGIGKSGHIARKMAATFASTGTPSFYVHPSEASHGDLGMIAEGDVVVALSNSGGTTELADIVAYARRFSIPLIGITGGAASPLAEQSDVVLLLPAEPEACPHGLAPTTSTTMMLGLGDALAIALLRRRGFTRDDYKVLHPGGALGKRLKKVVDLMHGGDGLPLARRDAPMAEVILTMTAKSFGCVGIVADDGSGRLAGIITDGDLRRHMYDDLLHRTAAQIMTQDPRTIRRDALALEALGVMNDNRITALFVVDDRGQPTGILHIHDCLRAGVA